MRGFLFAGFSGRLEGLLPAVSLPPGGPLLDRNFARGPSRLTGRSRHLSPLGFFGIGVFPTRNDARGSGSLAEDEPEEPSSGAPREDVGELESRGLLRIRFLGKRELEGSEFSESLSDSCGVKSCDYHVTVI